MSYHTPVMLQECIEGLAIKPNGNYADVTFGGGGHSKLILKNLVNGKLIGFDKDPDATKNGIEDEKFLFVQQSFVYLKRFLDYHNMLPLDGLLADLGISSWQIDRAERGFSTRFEDAPLDMSMGQQKDRNAKTVLLNYSAYALQNMFSRYGEIINSKKLANAIVDFRQTNELNTTRDLKKAIESCVIREMENRYYAQVFQALRIEVNNEIEELQQLLIQAGDVLAPGGRLVVLSYHSLEDRLVKSYIAKGKFEGELERDVFGNQMGAVMKSITRKPIVASEDELLANPRARSAKLRIAEKLQHA